MPMVGGSRPDLRLSVSGKLIDGTGTETPRKDSVAPCARPTSSSSSMRMLAARRIHAGIQPGKSSRWQVV